MKKLALMAGFFALAGCTSPELSETLYASIFANNADYGATLIVDWNRVKDATGYTVTADGQQVYSGSEFSTIITTPAETIIVAVTGGSGDADTFITTTVKTSGFTLSEMDGDTLGLCALGFDTAGVPVVYSIYSSADWASFWLYVTDDTCGQVDYVTLKTASANTYNNCHTDSLYNKSVRGYVATTYDTSSVGPYPSYPTYNVFSAPLWNVLIDTAGFALSVWYDDDGLGWDSQDDHFVKLNVTNIDTTTGAVTLDAEYQKVPGLRWFR